MPLDYPLLSRISDLSDFRKLPSEELDRLAGEIRACIIDTVSRTGGHLASNLGAVELTMALHRVFDSPRDKIIWDVGHQCYTHKLITGRFPQFGSLRQLNGLSGFPKRSESEHDVVETGHSATSVSTGLGLLAGERLAGRRGKVIAVIGDGALTGGMALEGLNHAGHLQKDLVIVVNDNDMSIGVNVGALSAHLSMLTATWAYRKVRDTIDNAVESIPYYGAHMMDFIQRIKKGFKAVLFRENLFSDLGFDYVGPIDGHDLGMLTRAFQMIRSLDRPVVVHVRSRKGKGYRHAEGNPSLFHGVSPFSIVDGKIEKKEPRTYTEVFSNALLNAAGRDDRIIAITAAMAGGTGLQPFQLRYPTRFFDTGITEQHAVAFSAGLAASGRRPVVAIYSTFMQRAVDQVIHDVALPGLPVVIVMDRAGLVPGDGETHQGLYDIPLFRSVPNLTFLAPSGAAETEAAFAWALEHERPTLIRIPKDSCPADPAGPPPVLEEGRGRFLVQRQADLLLLSVGGLLDRVREARTLMADAGLDADIFDLRFIRPLDEDHLAQVLSSYRFVVTVEDGARSGGIGEAVAALASSRGLSARVLPLGAPDRFLSQAGRGELLASCGLDGPGIAGKAAALVEGTAVRPGKTPRPSAPRRRA